MKANCRSLPSHSRQGFLMKTRVPRHCRHVLRITKGPVLTVSMPLPLQAGHLMGFVPVSHLLPPHLGQVSVMLTRTCLFTPRAASWKVRSMTISWLRPKPLWLSIKSSMPSKPVPAPERNWSPKILRKSSSGSMCSVYAAPPENPPVPPPGQQISVR